MANLETYQNLYRYIRLKREDGILEVMLHSNDGPAVLNFGKDSIHAELVDVFYRIGQDLGNRIVILTGAGDEFMTEMEYPKEEMNSDFWSHIHKGGRDLMQNLLGIDVPIIGAVNGPAFIHAELLTLSDIVIASDRASFADKSHAPGGVVPGDGVHVWWQMLLGPNRGRHFLITGSEIDAHEGLRLGFVAEVVPHEKLLERTWEVARELAQKPTHMLRYTRIAMTQHIKRRMLDDLGYGLLLEAMSAYSNLGK